MLNQSGQLVAESRHRHFCLIDTDRVPRRLYGQRAGDAQFTSCTYQGLSNGWSDVFNAKPGDPFIDVTDVAPGDYVLRITANPIYPDGRLFSESDYSNNVATRQFTIP